jgi:hypothetical protein
MLRRFLDEINTCLHMGLLNETISIGSIHGRPIPKGIQIFAACNPYRERKKVSEEAGMEYRDTTPGAQENEMKKLVYAVKPIPDGTLSYVFDYGALKANIERTYVESMVSRLLDDGGRGQTDRTKITQYANLIWKASEFIRLHEGDPAHHTWRTRDGQVRQPEYAETSATSLRDVARCLKLLVWFAQTRGPSEGAQMNRPVFPPQDWFDENNIPEERTKKPFVNDPLTPRAMVLSLALVYFFRLSNRNDRNEFRRRLAEAAGTREFDERAQQAIVDGEMDMYSEKMELEIGGLKDIAMNEALKENVFVMTVCILNRVPAFVVGKPGSSKSLAIQIVVNNVRSTYELVSLFCCFR